MPFPAAAQTEVKQQRIPGTARSGTPLAFLGIVNNLPPDLIPPNAFADAQDIVPGFGDKRPGNTTYLTTAPGSACQGLFPYHRQTSAQRFLLWGSNGVLYRDDSTSLRTGLNATNKWEFSWFLDVAYFVDGGGLHWWDGTNYGKIHPTSGVGAKVPYVPSPDNNELNDANSKVHTAKLITVYKNHVCLAGAPTLPYRVWFSDLTQSATDSAPTYFKGTDALDFQSPRGGGITGLVPTSNALVVFKEDAIFTVTGARLADFVRNTISVEVGCPAGRTAKFIPGLGVVFQAGDGHFYRLIGLEGTDAQFVIRRLSKHFTGDYNNNGIQNLNMAKLGENAAGVYGDLYWCSVCTGANTVPDKVFVMNHRKLAPALDNDPSADFVPWSIYTHPAASVYAIYNNGSSEFFLAGHNATGQIFKLDEGNSVDGASTAIDAWVLTPKLVFGRSERRKTLQYVHIKFEGVTNSGATMATTIYVDDKAGVTLASLDITGTPSQYGTAVFGTDVYGIRRTNKTKRLAVNKTGQLFQFKFRQNTASVPFRLFEFTPSFTYGTEV